MSFKKTLVLALLVGGLLAYIWYAEMPRKEARDNKSKIFYKVEKDQIVSVGFKSEKAQVKLLNIQSKIDSKDAEKFSLGKKWRIEGLDSAELDDPSLSNLFSAISDFKAENPIPSEDLESDLSVYGLKDPLAKITITTPSGDRSIEFGKKNSFSNLRYAKIEGDNNVYSIGDQLFSAIDKKAEDFRDRTPLEYQNNDLNKISIISNTTEQTKKIIFDANKDFNWSIVEPIKATANLSAINTLNSSLKGLRAADFVDQVNPNLADFGLDKPELQIILDFKAELNKAALKLNFSKITKENNLDSEDSAEDSDDEDQDSAQAQKPKTVELYYFQIENKPGIYRLTYSPKDSVLKDINEYREKRLFSLPTENIKNVKFTMADGKSLDLVKSGEIWTLNQKTADAPFVNALLDNLVAISASSFPESNSQDFGFNQPQLKVEVGHMPFDSNKPQDLKISRLVIGSKVAQSAGDKLEYYAGVNDFSEPFIINEEALKKITPREETLVKVAEAEQNISQSQPAENTNAAK